MKPLNFLILLFAAGTLFTGCMEFTSNRTPEINDDYSVIIDHISKLTNSKNVVLWVIIKENGDRDPKSAELRIDLIKPDSFSTLSSDNNAKAKEIIHWLNPKLKNPEQYNNFSINEITNPTELKPDQNIAKTIKIDRNDL